VALHLEAQRERNVHVGCLLEPPQPHEPVQGGAVVRQMRHPVDVVVGIEGDALFALLLIDHLETTGCKSCDR